MHFGFLSGNVKCHSFAIHYVLHSLKSIFFISDGHQCKRVNEKNEADKMVKQLS